MPEGVGLWDAWGMLPVGVSGDLGAPVQVGRAEPGDFLYVSSRVWEEEGKGGS